MSVCVCVYITAMSELNFIFCMTHDMADVCVFWEVSV